MAYAAFYEQNRVSLIARATESARKRRERPEVREAERAAAREAKRRLLADPVHAERLREQGRIWRQENRERVRSAERERRAAKRGPKRAWDGMCSSCGTRKPVTREFFYFRPNGTVFGRTCKACHGAAGARWRSENAEIKRERERERLSTPEGREAKRRADAASYRRNREKRLASCAEYRRRDDVKQRRREIERERFADPVKRAQQKQYLTGYNIKRRSDLDTLAKLRADARQWAKDNPEKAKAVVRNRRARLRNAEGTHTAGDVHRLLEAQNCRCHWCEADISGGKHTVDHYVPIARGGTNGPDNLVMACAACNYSKSDKLPDEFRAYLERRAAVLASI